jgi:acyl-CoA thioester hydrolase
MTREHHASFEIERKVAFYELDPMQIVWHGNYYKYFEDARSGLLRQAGLDLHDFYLSSNCVFPIIKTATKHIFPLRYGDAFICRATVAECKEKLVIDFEIRLKEGGRVCVKGRTEQVAVQMPEGEMQFELPAAIRSALGML